MRQLAGTRTRYRRAHAAPLTGLFSDRLEYNLPQLTKTTGPETTNDELDAILGLVNTVGP